MRLLGQLFSWKCLESDSNEAQNRVEDFIDTVGDVELEALNQVQRIILVQLPGNP